VSYDHRIRIRYDEVDMQRVVFNAHYLTYCDDAISSWMHHVELEAEALGWDCMLVKAVVEWQGSATFGDHLDIAVAIDRWGRSSYDAGFTGTVGGRPVFTATITYVSVRHGTVEPVPTPETVRSLFTS
jgi:acyl-CoA thioester hydrolase